MHGPAIAVHSDQLERDIANAIIRFQDACSGNSERVIVSQIDVTHHGELQVPRVRIKIDIKIDHEHDHR